MASAFKGISVRLFSSLFESLAGFPLPRVSAGKTGLFVRGDQSDERHIPPRNEVVDTRCDLGSIVEIYIALPRFVSLSLVQL